MAPIRGRDPEGERAARDAARELPNAARILLFAAAALTVFGQVMVYSASSATAMTSARYNHDSLYFVKTGAIYLVVGVLGLLLAMRVPMRLMRAWAPVVLVGSIVGLVGVLAVGPIVNGAQRWIVVGPLSVQPSEFAKLGLLGAVASALAGRRRPPATARELLVPIGLVTGLVCALVVKQPDLGTTISIVLMIGAMVVVSGVPGWLVARVGVAGIGAFVLSIAMSSYQRARFTAFLDPWSPHQAADGAYQVVNAMIGIGSGGVFGDGIGNGIVKTGYLPEAHTDMIFAVIGEETGLVGAAIVIGLFAAFAWAGYSIALQSRDRFRGLVAVGATSLITGQAVVNLGAVMGVLPLTGIPLPLISYGSSSRLVTLLMVGLLVRIAREDAAEARKGGDVRVFPQRPDAATRAPRKATRRAASGRVR